MWSGQAALGWLLALKPSLGMVRDHKTPGSLAVELEVIGRFQEFLNRRQRTRTTAAKGRQGVDHSVLY